MCYNTSEFFLKKIVIYLYFQLVEKKKMIKEKCPVCGGHKKKAEKNIRVTFLFSTESKKDQKATIFKDTLQEIVKDKIPIESKAACLSVLLQKLPIVFKSQIPAWNTFPNICHC